MGGWRFLLSRLFGSCTLIHQIDNAHIRDTRIRFQTDFAGTTLGLAHLDLVGLNLWTELTETVLV